MLKHGSGTKGTRRSYTDIASRRGMFMRFGLMVLLGYLTSVIVQVTGRWLVKRMVVDGSQSWFACTPTGMCCDRSPAGTRRPVNDRGTSRGAEVMGQRDADYYQRHKDEPEEWGEAQAAPKPRSRRLAAMISVRFTPDEEEIVREAALSANESVSHFVRQAALKAARSREPGMRVASPSALSTTSTTSFPGTTEMLTGSVLVQFSEPSPATEDVHVG
jgi:hypothetical protein